MTAALRARSEQRKLNPRTDPYTPWLHIDVLVVIASVGLSIISVIMIYSATRGRDFENFDTAFRDRQALFAAVGFGLLVVLSIIDYRSLFKYVWTFYAGSIALLILVLIDGIGSTDSSGIARSWFRFGSVGLQPSEPTKLAVILALAWWLSRIEGRPSIGQLGVALLISATPMLLINEQPDLGTMLVFVVITAAVLLVGGADWRHLSILTATAVAAGWLAVPRLDNYQRTRLTAFVDPSIDANYNVEQAQIAIGNGGLTGAGFGRGTQTNSGLVPEQHTDFIFTVIGEELGLVGGMATIALFGVLVLRVFRTMLIAGDRFGTMICAGVLAMFVFQTFQSIGMTMGIMPVTGIPLPFISYGGSSALTSFGGVGLVLSVHMRRYEASIEGAR